MAGSSLDDLAPVGDDRDRRPGRSVHTHLRQLIVDGTLPPGTVLPQIELSKRLGVSRTPLREALRMLAEEGLVEAPPNRRARVTSLAPAELDVLYATRILLEGLGFEMTVARLGSDDLRRIEHSLKALEDAHAAGESADWRDAHVAFHRLLLMHGGDRLQREIDHYADQSQRYRKLYALAGPRAWSGGPIDHAALVEACRLRDPRHAAALLARHLGHSALSIMTHLAPEVEPGHIRAAVSLIAGGPYSSA